MNTFIDRTEVIPFTSPWSGSFDISFLVRHTSVRNGVTSITYATQMKMEKRTPENDHTVMPPLFRLNQTEAQMLMDRLWDCGVRPTEAKGSAGQLSAVQAHLKDMQTLVFDFVAVNSKPTLVKRT